MKDRITKSNWDEDSVRKIVASMVDASLQAWSKIEKKIPISVVESSGLPTIKFLRAIESHGISTILAGWTDILIREFGQEAGLDIASATFADFAFKLNSKYPEARIRIVCDVPPDDEEQGQEG